MDGLIAAKAADLQRLLVGTMTEERIRLREEVQEQIRALGELKQMAAAYGECHFMSEGSDVGAYCACWLVFGERACGVAPPLLPPLLAHPAAAAAAARWPGSPTPPRLYRRRHLAARPRRPRGGTVLVLRVPGRCQGAGRRCDEPGPGGCLLGWLH